MKRIILIDNNSSMLLNFRGNFIKELTKYYEVYVISPLFGDDAQKLSDIGVKGSVNNPYLKRKSTNPVADLKLLKFYKQKIREFRPDIVFNYTIKCCIWGSMAARALKVEKIFSMVTGLNYCFTEVDSFKKKALNLLVQKLYKRALKFNYKTFLLNSDDRDLFVKLGVIAPNKATVLSGGEGVDLNHFEYVPRVPKKVTFIMLSRLLKHKGVFEYCEAAKVIKAKYGDMVEFVLAGPLDDNPNSLTPAQLHKVRSAGIIKYLGVLTDVRPALVDSSVVVLPTYYREGVPRSILEAMSIGRAIITTDMPGCKETVVDGVNGYLVAPKDVDALAEAMGKFILDPSRAEQMGAKSRIFAKRKFDINIANKNILTEIMNSGADIGLFKYTNNAEADSNAHADDHVLLD